MDAELRRQKARERALALGKTRFVIYRGVLCNGLFAGVIFAALLWYWGSVQTLAGAAFAGVLFMLLNGIWSGLWAWSSLQKQQKRD